jgi:hypothetical protein
VFHFDANAFVLWMVHRDSFTLFELCLNFVGTLLVLLEHFSFFSTWTPWTTLKAITLSLSETARAGALRLSGTPGGDGGGVLVDIGQGAVTDMAGNLIASATNLPVTETPDTVVSE